MSYIFLTPESSTDFSLLFCFVGPITIVCGSHPQFLWQPVKSCDSLINFTQKTSTFINAGHSWHLHIQIQIQSIPSLDLHQFYTNFLKSLGFGGIKLEYPILHFLES
ncbi:hypothetical protein L6452_28646 [Arctium lappa]|uniref:Uncharacterized protein n=1 Tax=Arctium lappa TaxID=4217 RepID=A0ACB8ZZ92_ARCLA|nr:hypothetical protein L6452_28646 [Arctium lappa]